MLCDFKSHHPFWYTNTGDVRAALRGVVLGESISSLLLATENEDMRLPLPFFTWQLQCLLLAHHLSLYIHKHKLPQGQLGGLYHNDKVNRCFSTGLFFYHSIYLTRNCIHSITSPLPLMENPSPVQTL